MTKEPEYVYKVVSEWNPTTMMGMSATIKAGVCKLKYGIGFETKPVKGTVGIVIFRTLNEARTHELLTYGLEEAILKCEYTGEIEEVDRDRWKHYRDLFNYSYDCDLLRYIAAPGNTMNSYLGTYRVDSVIPVCVIDKSESYETRMMKNHPYFDPFYYQPKHPFMSFNYPIEPISKPFFSGIVGGLTV